MNYFEEATLRLKQVLGCRLDKDVASLLGLSGRAWSGRKKANNFPEAELYALAAKRPELAIDVNYVLTGQRAKEPKVNQPLETVTAEFLNNALGERLREERERLGYNQTAFAELGGVKKQAQLKWEKGDSSPTAVQLAALGVAGVDVLYVITGQRSKVDLATVGSQSLNRHADLCQLLDGCSDRSLELLKAMAQRLREADSCKRQ